MKEYRSCGTCKFLDTDANKPPCKSCRYAHGEAIADNWQSTKNDCATPKEYHSFITSELIADNWQSRPKRNALEAQLAASNAELESMHRELADKQAIIAEQAKEIEEANRKQGHIDLLQRELDSSRKYESHLAKVVFDRTDERNEARRWAIKLRDEVAKLREWSKKDKAIIDLLEKERDEARLNAWQCDCDGEWF